MRSQPALTTVASEAAASGWWTFTADERPLTLSLWLPEALMLTSTVLVEGA
jgi:hypothetical protein